MIDVGINRMHITILHLESIFNTFRKNIDSNKELPFLHLVLFCDSASMLRRKMQMEFNLVNNRLCKS